MRSQGFRATLAVFTLVAGMARAQGAAAEVYEVELQEMHLVSQNSSGYLSLHMLRFEVVGAMYGGGTDVDAGIRPAVFVFGCVVFGKSGIWDYGCGYQSASSMTTDQDLEKTTMRFTGRSKGYRLPITGRFTALGYGTMTKQVVRRATVPTAPGQEFMAEAGVLSSRPALSSGSATIGGLGSVRLSSVRAPATWLSAVGTTGAA
jgi:hypothetical protein